MKPPDSDAASDDNPWVSHFSPYRHHARSPSSISDISIFYIAVVLVVCGMWCVPIYLWHTGAPTPTLDTWLELAAFFQYLGIVICISSSVGLGAAARKRIDHAVFLVDALGTPMSSRDYLVPIRRWLIPCAVVTGLTTLVGCLALLVAYDKMRDTSMLGETLLYFMTSRLLAPLEEIGRGPGVWLIALIASVNASAGVYTRAMKVASLSHHAPMAGPRRALYSSWLLMDAVIFLAIRWLLLLPFLPIVPGFILIEGLSIVIRLYKARVAERTIAHRYVAETKRYLLDPEWPEPGSLRSSP